MRALLAAIAGGERHALGMYRVTHVRIGRLYPLLAEAERKGWLRSTWIPADEVGVGSRRRVAYTITATGAERLKMLRASIDQPVRAGPRPLTT